MLAADLSVNLTSGFLSLFFLPSFDLNAVFLELRLSWSKS